MSLSPLDRSCVHQHGGNNEQTQPTTSTARAKFYPDEGHLSLFSKHSAEFIRMLTESSNV